MRAREVYGWAWEPGAPGHRLTIELIINGEAKGAAEANVFRGDLRSAGIGDGRYGWRIPFPVELGCQGQPLHVVVRASNGMTLTNGDFIHRHEPPEEDQANLEYRAFVGTVLRWPDGPITSAGAVTSIRRPLNILVTKAGEGAASLGASEYSYGFAAHAYRPVLDALGTVHDVTGDPARADILHHDFLACGEGSLMLSFFPPHMIPLNIQAPIIPVIAWEYPTIPDGGWCDIASEDWRFVLRQTGRAIVASSHTADAVRSAMGKAFPIAVIPHPVFDRIAYAGAMRRAGRTTTIAMDALLFDSSIHGTDVSRATPSETVTVDGIMFVCVLAPRDGRKAWRETITAFVDAHRDNADATLVLKMIALDVADWQPELQDLLAAERPFVCRLVVIHGYLAPVAYASLASACHWIVSATLAEGQCLPLLEFMSAGRPAISACHSAMVDYITPSNALIVAHCEELCAWPNDTLNRMLTKRARLDWRSLRDVLLEAYSMVRDDPAAYAAMGRSARETMRTYCSDAVVAERLDSFLGLGAGLAASVAPPSAMMFDETLLPC